MQSGVTSPIRMFLGQNKGLRGSSPHRNAWKGIRSCLGLKSHPPPPRWHTVRFLRIHECEHVLTDFPISEHLGSRRPGVRPFPQVWGGCSLQRLMSGCSQRAGPGLNAGEMNCPHMCGLHVLQSLIYLMLLMRSASWGPAAAV